MRRICLLFVLVCLSTFSYGQKEVVEFLKAGKNDANTLFRAYLQPYATSLGDGLNTGWFTTAQPHKLLGFDLSISVTGVSVPSSDKYFDLNSLNFQSVRLADPGNHIAPTVAGPNQNGPTLNLYTNYGGADYNLTSFQTPSGTGYSFVPIPVIQLGVGVLPKTDLMIRYVPDINVGSGNKKMKVGLSGFGLKNNFTSLIPGLSLLPFDMAVYVGYSRLTASSGLDLKPSDYGTGVTNVDYVDAHDQELSIKTKTFTFGLIASKKLGPLTVFGSLGHANSKTDVDLLGKYPTVTPSLTGPVIKESESLYDPIALNYKNNTVNMNAGLRLKLLFFSVFASVNKEKYTSYNTGISFGFR